MPKATVTVQVMVTLDIPAEFAGKCTRDDLIEMARSSIPDSMVHPDPVHGLGAAINGTQLIVHEKAQEDETGSPVFADVFIEHDTCSDAEVDYEDDVFTTAVNTP